MKNILNRLLGKFFSHDAMWARKQMLAGHLVRRKSWGPKDYLRLSHQFNVDPHKFVPSSIKDTPAGAFLNNSTPKHTWVYYGYSTINGKGYKEVEVSWFDPSAPDTQDWELYALDNDEKIKAVLLEETCKSIKWCMNPKYDERIIAIANTHLVTLKVLVANSDTPNKAYTGFVEIGISGSQHKQVVYTHSYPSVHEGMRDLEALFKATMLEQFNKA